MGPTITDPHPAARAPVGAADLSAGHGSWIWPLVATLVLQATSAFLTRLVPTIGPALIVEMDWSETTIGYLSSVGTVGSIAFLLAGMPLIRRTGPIRALQIGLALGVLGVAALVLPIWVAPVLGSFLIGFGYGTSSPAGSDVLQRHAPARHRNLLFSIKQAGVPLGGVLAGLALPPIAEWAGWRATVAFAILVAALTILAVEPLRGRIDTDREDGLRLRLGLFLSPDNLKGPIGSLRSSPDIWRIAWVGACLAVGQSTWFTFLITYLVTRLGLSLPAAGLVFAVMQATGIFGRILLGWISDRLGSGLTTLRIVALASAASSVALALTGAGSPFHGLLLLSAVGGVTVSSWNGVQIAEIARLAPRHLVSETAAGATILVFIGYVLGPTGFAAIIALTDRFDIAFFAVALMSAASLLALVGPGAAQRPQAD